MEATGFIFEYKVNRPLTKDEKDKHLSTSLSSNAIPDDQKSVIRMNSTYLELADKFFSTRGWPTAFSLPFIVIMIWFGAFLVSSLIERWTTQNLDKNLEALATVAFIWAIFLLMIWFLWKKLLSKEIFHCTHYPIRFNRKNRKVYVFRKDGSVMTANWDEVFFTLAECKDGIWEVRGYRMDADGETILEVFPLPYYNSLGATEKGQPLVLSQWEFVRRYMEQGPEVLASDLKQVLRIEDRKESFWCGCARLAEDDFAANRFFGLIMLPVNLIIGICRWIVMRTCRIPEWAQDVDAECEVEYNDPYEFNSSSRFERIIEI